MARLGRRVPNRPRIIKGRYYRPVDLTLGAFETTSEWPPVTVTTPNVNLFLPAFETTSEWPPVTLAFDANLALPAFETVSEWPEITVSIPAVPGDLLTGADGEIEWRGLVFGGNQALFRVTELEGWEDLPGIDSGNTPLPNRDGSYPGRKLAQERIVVATIVLDDDTPTFAANLAALRAVTAIEDDDTEFPLVIRLRDETLLASAAVIGRIVPTGLVGAGIAQVSVRWVCSDPRRYNPDRSGISLPVGVQTAVGNAGNKSSHPLIRIDGPFTDPTLVNADTGRTLAFDLDVLAGQQLVIDTINGNALLDDEPVTSAITGTSAPIFDFTLKPGVNQITFTTAAAGDQAVLLYRDAWL